MPSFQITIAPSRRAAARYVVAVRRELQRVFATEAATNGLTQAAIGRKLDVNRSVINRELKGEKDITQGRVGELAWAMGYRPVFRLEKVEEPSDGLNVRVEEVVVVKERARNDAEVKQMDFEYAD